MKKAKHIFNIIAIFLCIVISFAWITDLQTPVGRYIKLAFEKDELVIASDQLDVQLLVQTNDNQFTDITQKHEKGKPLFTIEGFKPGDRTVFKVKLKNKGKAPASLEILFSDVIADSELLTNALIIGTTSYSGFPSQYTPPKIENYPINQKLNNGSFKLTSTIVIPPNSVEVELQFYIFFDRMATTAVSNKNFSIGTISFLTV